MPEKDTVVYSTVHVSYIIIVVVSVANSQEDGCAIRQIATDSSQGKRINPSKIQVRFTKKTAKSLNVTEIPMIHIRL